MKVGLSSPNIDAVLMRTRGGGGAGAGAGCDPSFFLGHALVLGVRRQGVCLCCTSSGLFLLPRLKRCRSPNAAHTSLACCFHLLIIVR